MKQFENKHNKYYIATIVKKSYSEFGEDMTTNFLLVKEMINYKAFINVNEPVIIYKDVATDKTYLFSEFVDILPYSKLNKEDAKKMLELYIKDLKDKKSRKKTYKIVRKIKQDSPKTRKN